MFGTLLGGLPRPDAELGDPLDAVLRAQEAAGLEPLTDGRLGTPDLAELALRLDGVERSPSGDLTVTRLPARRGPVVVEEWLAASRRTRRAVKQALPGPYSLLRRLDTGRFDQADVLGALADALAAEISALAEAGCPLVEIEETQAHRIGTDESERRRFREAHARLTPSGAGTHLSLSIVGGAADGAGVETILAAPYASLAVDLIAGPDNWRLVVRTPGDRGIVAGVLEPGPATDDRPELPVWAAHYAASTGGRGLARVGLGTAGGLARLSWPAAVTKLRRLGEAARIAGLPPADQAGALDPRALDIRTAALGRHAPRAARPPRRRP
jgi:methionine synthase II (cobalamin-independent)